METTLPDLAHPSNQPLNSIIEQATPFSQDQVIISKEEYINLTQQAKYWQSLHAQSKQKNAALEEEVQYLKAKIKDLQNRLFGKKSEKKGLAKSEQTNKIALVKNEASSLAAKAMGVLLAPASP